MKKTILLVPVIVSQLLAGQSKVPGLFKTPGLSVVAGYAMYQGNYIPNPVPVPRHKFIVIAHRGDHVTNPENTLAAYAQAIKDSADYVEIDLRTTKDGRLISLHNESVDRMTNGKGLVKDMLLADIKKLKINSENQGRNLTIPTFQEILNLCKNKIYIYIDFKEADPAAAYALLKQYGMEKQVLVYINKPEQFTQWRTVAPKMPLMLSLADDAKDDIGIVKFINQYHPDVLDGNFKQYNTELVAAANSLHVPAWPDGQSGSEGTAVWDEAIAKGLTGLQTDHPEALINYLKQKGLR
ncbi:glycerophosphodiester phosphodiesterase family protein [Mucilaginibacter sp. FT3.2]|uniref:glycerophosphodiester phosphodiesterase family protein n=1 Tax=Mucilaginibacter sp. FT3.2 TaxID=2723090 RepID=UPI0016138BE0|nr:glycerophosphodiester phosphodiesterase family protein [Mucilaginibacter sp. FT3.2]MBB6234907.1 glycerophosphoryl diester phosphodiesterase [Mucilaginibacter sp. FT3.2]